MNALRAPAEPTDAQAWPVEALRFEPRTATDAGWRREQVLVGIGVVVLHVLLWWLFEAESRRRAQEDAGADAAIVVTWIETLPRQWIRAPRAPVQDRVTPPRPATTIRRPAPPRTPAPRATPATDAPLQLYERDGSLRLPHAVLEDLDQRAGAPQFGFQMPDLDAAARLLDRPPALVYEPTRFDEYWEPNEDLLNEVLRKAVEKTTKEVRIPIPGAPGRSLVCRVSLLAAGGACGVERNGGNAVVSLDDPKTLSATEAAACAAWWDRIVGAATQAEWRATRKLYEAECRKPLEKVAAQARP